MTDYLAQVPPTNGWMLELGREGAGNDFKCGYRLVENLVWHTLVLLTPSASTYQATLSW